LKGKERTIRAYYAFTAGVGDGASGQERRRVSEGNNEGTEVGTKERDGLDEESFPTKIK
jgi:hypothetical protein